MWKCHLSDNVKTIIESSFQLNSINSKNFGTSYTDDGTVCVKYQYNGKYIPYWYTRCTELVYLFTIFCNVTIFLLSSFNILKWSMSRVNAKWYLTFFHIVANPAVIPPLYFNILIHVIVIDMLYIQANTTYFL